MTNFTKTMMVAAAALTLAGAASAQNLKADIPFAFTVGNKLMQPGTYEISRINTTGVLTYKLMNREQRETVIASPTVPHDAAKAWRADGKARLAFECGATQCTLADMWDGDPGSSAHQFQTHRSHRESMRVAVIVAEPVKSE